jgi:hypothetical protein
MEGEGITTPSAAEDRELLDGCRSGDPDAYGLIYRRHSQAILGYLPKRTASPETAADLMAETFAKGLADVLGGNGPLPAGDARTARRSPGRDDAR